MQDIMKTEEASEASYHLVLRSRVCVCSYTSTLNTPSWHDAQLKIAQGQLYLYLLEVLFQGWIYLTTQ